MGGLMLYYRARRVVAVLCCLPLVAVAAEPSPLPEPLTLDVALSLAVEAHPQLERAAAAVAAAYAATRLAEALNGANLNVEGRARWVAPPPALAAQGDADHRARVTLRKRLYDFGRSGAIESAAQSELKARESQLLDVRSQRRLEIMERFFDVLLADLEFARDNEAMAIGFIAYDRAKERQQLGQRSEIEVLEADAAYQEIRRKRFAGQAQQRATRARLALALHRPHQLSAKLAPPKLDGQRPLPEVAQLQATAIQANPQLTAKRAELAAARERLRAARADRLPFLDFEAEAGAYSRELGASDRWAAGVTLNVPLYQGGRVVALIAQREADIRLVEAELAELEAQIRETVLETWLELDTLRYRRDEADKVLAYRELYLDRARTQYEQEVTSDLGDAMVEFTAATLGKARIDYRIALAWERLAALTGSTRGDLP